MIDNEEFIKSQYDLTNAFISIRNGVVKGQYKLKNPFRIDDKFLFSGNLNVGITTYMNGKMMTLCNILQKQ